MLAVSGVLLLIIVSGRFIKYLGDAAAGKLEVGVLFQLIGLKLPSFLELILPLGLFIGVLLALGRLYLDSEMVVLRACGISQRRLVLYSLGPAGVTAVLVGALSLWIAPSTTLLSNGIFKQQEQNSELDTLSPGRFQVLPSGNRVTYTEELTDERRQMQEVFISERDRFGRLIVVVSESGRQVMQDDGRFLVLKDGYRYEGVPGQANYRKIEFGEYGVRMPDKGLAERVSAMEAIPTLELIGNDNPKYVAQLHWRISLPVLALVVTLMAVPLSHTNPRQGRYAKLIPSILMYLTYLTLLTSARGQVEDGDSSVALIWLIHLIFIAVAANLIFAERFWAGLWHKIPSLPKPKFSRGGEA